MPKPIAVIYTPRELSDGSGSILNPFDLAAGFNGMHSKYNFPRELYGDYLWFCFPSDSYKFKLQIFHLKDFTEIQYEELKALLTAEIQKITTKNEHN